MHDYSLTTNALHGIEEILGYVGRRFDDDEALRVGLRLRETFRRLAEHPGIGHVRHEVTVDSRVRFYSVGPSVIAYLYESRPLVILAVERGSRDWTQAKLRWATLEDPNES